MWVFTEVADWFDKSRKEGEKFIDDGLQPWVATTLYANSPWYRNVGIYAASGTLYALNKFTTTVAAGFVDVLRLGDGVQEGGWGFGKDALRLLMVVGPALRAARYAIAAVQELDVGTNAVLGMQRAGMSFEEALKAVPWVRNCGWVAAARILRLTGTAPMAALSDVARAAGIGVEQTGAIGAVTELDEALRSLGAPTAVRAVQGLKGIANLLRQNPSSSVMFGVTWGQDMGHVLVATRNFFGGISILDRSGAMVSTLEALSKSYPGIESATVEVTALLIRNSMLVRSLGTLPLIGNIISEGVGNYPPDRDVSGTVPAPVQPATQAAVAGSGAPARGGNEAGAGAPSRPAVVPGTYTVQPQTICIQQNSDTGMVCSTVERKTYKVGRGEGLMAIAQRVYGDASRWQAIATANGIKPPKYTIQQGEVLIIP